MIQTKDKQTRQHGHQNETPKGQSPNDPQNKEAYPNRDNPQKQGVNDSKEGPQRQGIGTPQDKKEKQTKNR